MSEDLFNLLILQLELLPCVVIDETAPISYPEISTVIPLLLDAVMLVPVIVPVDESPVAFIAQAVIVPNEMSPG